MKITPEIKKALKHVQKYIPNVTTVVFLLDGTWLYFDENNEIPVFPDDIDVGILEDASDSAHLPSIYSLYDIKEVSNE